jgi:hypothetical protein
MGRLHGRNHAERVEALEVVRCDHLAVFDAEAVVAAGDAGGFQRALVGVESEAVTAVADCVRAHLKAGRESALRRRLDAVDGRQQQSEIARLVVVGFEEGRSARAQGAVGVELDGAHDDTPAGQHRRTLAQPLGHEERIGPVDHAVHAQR